MLDRLDTTASALVWIAIAVPLTLLWLAVIVDLFRRKDLSVAKKWMWGAIVFFAVHVGVLAYFVLRPLPPARGKRGGTTSERASGIVAGLERLHEQRATGDIDADAYLKAKRELLGLHA